MSHGAPQIGFADAFDDHHGKKQPWNLDAADQTVRREGSFALRRRSGHRLRRGLAGCTPVAQQPVEVHARAPLEEPGIRQRESAIT